MKSILISSATLLAAVSLMAADKDDLTSAIQKLSAADNYSWTTKVESGTGGQNAPGPSHGKTEKSGLLWMDMTRGEATTEGFAKGEKAVIKTEEGWEALDLSTPPARGGGGGGGGGGGNATRYMGMMLRNAKAPAVQAETLVKDSQDITKTGDEYSGNLTEDGAKSLLTMGGGRRGGNATVTNPKGSVKFWVKDGMVTKYELKVSGTVSRNGNDRDIDRTTTVEINDVGNTHINPPDEAKNKLG